MKIEIKRAWNGQRKVFQPGVYAIPSDLSLTHAKCCVADGCGEIKREAGGKPASTFQKAGAPENKLRGSVPAAPLTKQSLRGGGERAKPDA